MTLENNQVFKGRALIDSGASVDTICMPLALKAGLDKISDARDVYDFQGNLCTNYGITRASIQIGKLKYESDFTMVKSKYQPEIILGLPFFQKYGLEDTLRSNIESLTGKGTIINLNE